MKMYRVDYSNEQLGLEDEFDIIHARTDKEATSIALNDHDYNAVKSIW